MKNAFIAIAVVALALPAVSQADPGKGHGNKGAGHPGHSAMANGAWTPPGLAKKPHGMPPGQAKKKWAQGDQLPTQYYTQPRYFVANPSVANLPPAPYGSRWVQVGDQYYLARSDTGVVSQILSALVR